MDLENKINTEPSATIKELSLKDLFLIDKLTIPLYQRPYRWGATTHVAQLLKDIDREYSTKNEYRIGSIILHKNNKKKTKDVVDGQQRLITLTLLLLVLGVDEEKLPLLSNDFNHIESKINIKNNYSYIKRYFEINGLEVSNNKKDELIRFILEKCTFSIITVFKIGDAFQLFDSQNSRGKELSPVDLLKAYHLRNMDDCSEDEKRACVLKWEKAIDENRLMPFLSKYLFRIRNWSNDVYEYEFSKDKINEFKGISRSEMMNSKYPYIYPMIHGSLCSYFQIDEPIINGKRFFDYVDYYLHSFEKINFYKNKGWENDNPHIKWWRLIDQRVENFYKNALFYYYSKFGDDEKFCAFADEIFKMSFFYILLYRSLRDAGIMNNLTNHNEKFKLFKTIKSWYRPDIIQLRNSIVLPSSELNYAQRWNFEKGIKKDVWESLCNNLKEKI